jgi:hypothetical protein
VRNNVTIKIFEHGELVEVRHGHNVWVDGGRMWLANMVGYTSHDPDVPEATTRVRYFGMGIGSLQQSLMGLVSNPPYSTTYPGTNLQKASSPWGITALERPVKVNATDWLVDDPKLFFTHLSPYDMTVHAVVDGSAGDVVFGAFTQMPISEVGLFLSDATITSSSNPVVAYHSFATILLNVNVRLEFIWSVRF